MHLRRRTGSIVGRLNKAKDNVFSMSDRPMWFCHNSIWSVNAFQVSTSVSEPQRAGLVVSPMPLGIAFRHSILFLVSTFFLHCQMNEIIEDQLVQLIPTAFLPTSCLCRLKLMAASASCRFWVPICVWWHEIPATRTGGGTRWNKTSHGWKSEGEQHISFEILECKVRKDDMN